MNRHARTQEFQENMQKLLNAYFQARDEKQILKKLPHVPCAYQFDASRQTLRADANRNKIHKFLVVCNEAGLLTRQEFVSMLPPLFLNCEEGEKVIDMCAAPGSKTSQLMEQVGMNGL